MKSIIFTKALTAGAVLLAAVAAAQDVAANDAQAGAAAAGAGAATAQGADAKDAAAALQDQNDIINNAQAVGEGALAQDAAVAPPNAPNPLATGGKGGTDPATGEPLFPLPSTSAFCQKSGQDFMDGTQNSKGDCSSAAQGQIPSVDNMVSTLIIEPENLAKLPLGQAFDVAAIVENMSTGFFTDPQTEYYTQPQLLDNQGRIKGHNHVTIQKIRDPRLPPNAQDKQFFKGLNFAADGEGKLSVTVDAASITEPGTYRICTLSGTFSHQPVIMPIAQRGAQDDCIRVEFVAAGDANGDNNGAGDANGDNNGANGDNNGANGDNNAANADNNGAGAANGDNNAANADNNAANADNNAANGDNNGAGAANGDNNAAGAAAAGQGAGRRGGQNKDRGNAGAAANGDKDNGAGQNAANGGDNGKRGGDKDRTRGKEFFSRWRRERGGKGRDNGAAGADNGAAGVAENDNNNNNAGVADNGAAAAGAGGAAQSATPSLSDLFKACNDAVDALETAVEAR